MTTTATASSKQSTSRLARRRDRRKAEIVQVATQMLATNGYRGTNLEVIAERTNIAKATLYHYFANKDELVSEALEALANDVIDRLTAVLEAAGSSSKRDQLRLLIQEQLRIITVDYPEVGSIFGWQGNWPARHDEARKSMRRRHDVIFRQVVEAGVEAGELDCDNVDVALQCHHAIMNNVSVWLSRVSDPTRRGVETEDVVRAVMRVFSTAEVERAAGTRRR